jgi:hypothetical protein
MKIIIFPSCLRVEQFPFIRDDFKLLFTLYFVNRRNFPVKAGFCVIHNSFGVVFTVIIFHINDIDVI